jgi:hypothetical protein
MRIAARKRRTFPAVLENGVELVQQRIQRLNLERQDLRDAAADADALERNRLAIVAAQWELSRELIALYLPAPQRNAA